MDKILDVGYKIYDTKNLYLEENLLKDKNIIVETSNDDIGIAAVSHVHLSYNFLLMKQENIGNYINGLVLNNSIRVNPLNDDVDNDKSYHTVELTFNFNKSIFEFLKNSKENNFIVFLYFYETEYDEDIYIKKLKYAFEFKPCKVYTYYINDIASFDSTITVLAFFENLNYLSFIDNKFKDKIELLVDNN